MAKNISSLSVALNASVAPFANAMHAGEHAVDSFIGKVGSIGSSLLDMTGVAGIVGGALGSIFALGDGFKLAGEFETANVQLSALTGSADTASKMLGELKSFAASSPFEFPELLDTSKRLLAAGVSAQSIVPLLKQVGDVAAGTGRPISEIADIFARVATEGRLGSRELLEFGRSGIPVVQALAQQFHTSANGVQAMAEAGQIGFKQLQQAFASMTGPGGRFAGIVESQSRTIGGAMHTLSATVQDSLADVAERMIQTFDLSGILVKLTSFAGSMGETITAGIDQVSPTFHRLTLAAESEVSGIYQAVVPVFERVWAGVSTAWGGIVSFVENNGTAFKAAIGGIGAVIGAAAIPALLGGIGAAATAVSTAFSALGAVLVIPLAPALALGAGIGLLATQFDIVGTASKVIGAVTSYIASNWESAVTATVEFGNGFVNVIEGAFNGVVDVVGGVLSTVSGWIVDAWDSISGSSDTGADMTAGAFDKVTKAAGWLGDASTSALNGLGYAFGHINDVIDVETTGIELGVVKAGSYISYTFTSVIPDVLSWAGSIFMDFGHATATIFENLGSNIVHVFSNLPGLIKGSVQWSDVWTPLTTGFEMQAKALPQIAARQVGPLESSLSQQYQILSDRLGDGMGNYIAQQAEKANDAAKKVNGTITDTLAKFHDPIKPTFTKAEIPQPDKFTVRTALDPSSQTLAITPEIHQAKILRSGSAEAESAAYLAPVVAGMSQPAGGVAAPYMPPTPSVPAATVPMSPAPLGDQKDELAEAKQTNTWLNRIEYNTRGSNQPQLVSI